MRQAPIWLRHRRYLRFESIAGIGMPGFTLAETQPLGNIAKDNHGPSSLGPMHSPILAKRASRINTVFSLCFPIKCAVFSNSWHPMGASASKIHQACAYVQRRGSDGGGEIWLFRSILSDSEHTPAANRDILVTTSVQGKQRDDSSNTSHHRDCFMPRFFAASIRSDPQPIPNPCPNAIPSI